MILGGNNGPPRPPPTFSQVVMQGLKALAQAAAAPTKKPRVAGFQASQLRAKPCGRCGG